MKRAGNLLSAFFERNNIHDSRGYVDFFQSWQQTVGTDLAAHSDAVDIRNHALLVEVDHPGWMQRLHMQRERILKSLQQRYPNLEIQNIHFTLVDEGRPRPSQQRTAGGNHGSGEVSPPNGDAPRPADEATGSGDKGLKPPKRINRPTFQHPEAAEPSEEERKRERREEPKPSFTEKEALKKIGSERLRERLESLGRHIHDREDPEEKRD